MAGTSLELVGLLCMGLLAAVVVNRRPPGPLWPGLAFLYGSIGLWLSGSLIADHAAGNPLVEWLGHIVLYLGVLFTPGMWWFLSFRFEELMRLRSGPPRRLALYGPLLFGLLNVPLLLTNPWHEEFLRISTGSRTLYGPLWYPQATVALGCVVGAIWRYIKMLRRIERPDLRAQLKIMIAASAAPIPFNLVYVSHLIDPGFDPTCIGLTVSGVLFFLGIYRFGLFALAEVHLKDLLYGTSNALFVLDPAGRIVEANPACARLLGEANCRPGEDAISHLAALIWPEKDSGGEALLRSLLESSRSEKATGASAGYMLAHPDIHHIQIRFIPFRNRRGAILGFGLEIQDVTGLVEAQAQLQSTEEGFHTFLERMPDPVFIHRRGRIFFANEAAAKFLGRSIESILGNPGLELLHPDERQKAIERQELIESGVDTGLREVVYLRGDGTPVYGEVRAVMTMFEGTRAALVTVRDLTERRQAEDERRRLEFQDQRRLRLESLGVFAGGIAHDFNNLLTAIYGNCELAMQGYPEDAPEARVLTRVIEATDRAADLVRQIQAYAGKGRFQRAKLSLSVLVREAARLMEPELPEKSRVTVQSEDDPVVWGDAGQIHQVLTSLILNASESYGTTGGRIEIRLKTEQLSGRETQTPVASLSRAPGLYAVIDVQDWGRGIEDAEQEKIFEPFYSTKIMGRGLGLSSVLGIVRAHGGTVLVKSAVEKGSTFSVLLPAGKPAVPLSAGKESSRIESDAPLTSAGGAE